MTPMLVPDTTEESLLVFSDVHLGSDLNDSADRASDDLRRTAQIDSDLTRLLDHYANRTPPGKRWRLVIAGDFIDFIGMSVKATDAEYGIDLTREECEHGLGNASEHTRIK